MDEGLSALIAGAAGLIGAFGGALIGGRAAVQGARISAEATAAVARYQMRIPAYRAFQISLDQFRHSLTSGEVVDVRALRVADQGVHANLHRVWEVGLEDVTTKARAITEACLAIKEKVQDRDLVSPQDREQAWRTEVLPQRIEMNEIIRRLGM
ncbi:hypothetical protein [Streptomyces avermitilis]|uniref:hypothetical protein n=1 Tax=Streptomyces avermitilis TaxID=33903 RepID=UPI0036752509